MARDRILAGGLAGAAIAKLADIADGLFAANSTGRGKFAAGFINNALLSDGMMVDRAYGEYTTNADITTQIPSDDSLPQSNEGVEIVTVTITPKSATNRVRLRFSGGFVSNTTGSNVTVALFKDSDTNALRARTVSAPVLNYHAPIGMEFEHVPGTTSAVTYKIRIGPGSAHTIRMNGSTSGRQLGGASAATLIAEEIKAS